MKLILLDESEGTWYEITNTSGFETTPKEDLKAIYHEIYTYFFVQDILDELVSDGKIECIDENGNIIIEEDENQKHYRYTMEYIKNILKEKMTNSEFNTFMKWCEDSVKLKD